MSDEAKPAEAQGSVEGGSTTFQMPPTSTPDAPDFNAFVPDEYKDKEWVRNISKSENPRQEIFKQFENAQKLIGQRPTVGLQVPGESASEAEVAAFHKALGVPDDIKGYEIKATPWADEDKKLGELLDGSRPAEFMDGIKAAAKAAGVNSKQLQQMHDAYNQLYLKHNKDALAQMSKTEAELNADFETKIKTHFGNRADQVLEAGKKILATSVPDNIKPLVANLDNTSLLILSAALDGVRTKYIKEDGAFNGAPAHSGAVSADEVQKEGRRLMSEKAYLDPMHPGHEAAVRAVKENYGRLRAVK